MPAQRWIRWTATLSAVVFPPLALLIAVRSYRAEKAIFFPPRAPLRVSAAQSGLPEVMEVEFGQPRVRGWYVPSRNGAAIVLTHGAGGDRSQVLPEARALVAKGFGALLFDWPGHGESEGEVHWQEPERKALHAAIDWLAGRPDVRKHYLGAFGFSMGGYVLAQVAAMDQRLSMVALAGTPTDVAAQSAWQFGRYGFLSRLPARWALERGGLRLEDQQPRAAVKAFAPTRDLLIVAGTTDHTVPIAMAHELLAAAGNPTELYVVEGADHGQYDAVAGSAYQARLTEFFARMFLE
jgi:pimeloyl-ACP methyl ester carboxylesterase